MLEKLVRQWLRFGYHERMEWSLLERDIILLCDGLFLYNSRFI